MNDINKFIVSVCLILLVCLFRALRHSREMRNEMAEMFVQRHIRLEIAGKKIVVVFFLPYQHDLDSINRERWISDIRDHLTINKYGEPGFENSPWREHLQHHGYRNACIVDAFM